MARIARNAKRRVLEALGDTRVVVIQGARQVGKTTLVREIVDSMGGRLVSFDDPVAASGAREDPVGFLNSDPERILAIDEVQRVPELVLALKFVVDTDNRPGRFLLTGSADLLRLPTIEDSLAGRTESIELFGLSQGELIGRTERFIDRALASERFMDHTSEMSRNDYLKLAVAGGYPEVLDRAPGRRRDLWFDNYANAILRREAEDISKLQRITDLPMILKMLAARSSGELNIADLARDANIPERTLAPYLELLQTLYLTQKIPAWTTNLTKRVVSRPKVSLLDTGLAARLMNVSAMGASFDANPNLAGGLLETFVAGEIRRQLTWCNETVSLFHFRDRNVGEVDLVLETPDGRVVGVEVKSSSNPKATDTKGLNYLRAKLGSRFVAGFILHTGVNSAFFGDRISAVPMDILWQA
ncbi:MAG: ATP-binding protein [Actinomycetota bacterium]|nr:ATP-binding protein [Actinomycetota bacterium]